MTEIKAFLLFIGFERIGRGHFQYEDDECSYVEAVEEEGAYRIYRRLTSYTSLYTALEHAKHFDTRLNTLLDVQKHLDNNIFPITFGERIKNLLTI